MTATQHQRITETVNINVFTGCLKNREAWLPLASGRKRHWSLVRMLKAFTSQKCYIFIFGGHAVSIHILEMLHIVLFRHFLRTRLLQHTSTQKHHSNIKMFSSVTPMLLLFTVFIIPEIFKVIHPKYPHSFPLEYSKNADSCFILLNTSNNLRHHNLANFNQRIKQIYTFVSSKLSK